MAVLLRLAVERSALAIGTQFLYVFILTALFTYLLVWLSRSVTYVRSHGWLIWEILIVAASAFVLYELSFLVRPNFYVSMGIVLIWDLVMTPIMFRIDRDRALIDTRDRVMFRNDSRLIRHMAYLPVMTLFLAAATVNWH